MKYLFIFSFLSFGVEAKRGVEFGHSTSNASRIRRKVANGSALILGSLCLPLLCAGYSMKLINFFFLICYNIIIWCGRNHRITEQKIIKIF